MSKIASSKAQKSKSASGAAKSRLTFKDQTKPGANRKSVDRPSSHARADTKLANMIEQLRRREGASIAQLIKITGWQAHSVRGAMSGALKKRLGLNITSSEEDGTRVYRITAGGNA